MKSDVAWEIERSVDADVPVWFAWEYMTDVKNWNDPPAVFDLDGPFEEGARGTTTMPGQPPVSWLIRQVEPGRAYTLEVGSFLEGATLLFHWRFEPVSENQTKLTQRIEVCGEQAEQCVPGVRAGFETTLEPGLKRIAERLTRASLHHL